MTVSASQLRSNIYKLLDGVIDGQPLEIERNGHILRVVSATQRTWVDRLRRRHGVVVGDSADLASLDWSQDWKPGPL